MLARLRAQSALRLIEMAAHGRNRDVQPIGDFAVGRTMRLEAQAFALAFRQMFPRTRQGRLSQQQRGALMDPAADHLDGLPCPLVDIARVRHHGDGGGQTRVVHQRDRVAVGDAERAGLIEQAPLSGIQRSQERFIVPPEGFAGAIGVPKHRIDAVICLGAEALDPAVRIIVEEKGAIGRMFRIDVRAARDVAQVELSSRVEEQVLKRLK